MPSQNKVLDFIVEENSNQIDVLKKESEAKDNEIESYVSVFYSVIYFVFG